MGRKLLRLYLESLSEKKAPFLDEGKALQAGLTLPLTKDQAHYLGTVMRLKAGDCFHVFANGSGEWRAELSHLDRKGAEILIKDLIRPAETDPYLGLAFSPIRSGRLSFLIEKATELGVTHFYPLITERTQHKVPPLDRLQAVAIEASEQSERLTVPFFMPAQKLSPFIEGLNGMSMTVTTLVCDERRQAEPLTSGRAKSFQNPLIMVGPEGGFSEKEFEAFEHREGVFFLRLGRYILRSETAALSVLAHFHSIF